MTMIFRLCLLFLLVSSAQAKEYKIETVAEGLSYPWAIAFLPNGDMLVT